MTKQHVRITSISTIVDKRQNTHLELGLDQLCAVLLQQLKQLSILDAGHLQNLS